MADHGPLSQTVTTADQEFDALVFRVSTALDAGQSLDLTEIAAEHPQHIERLRKLLPTLQAMADLGHSALAPKSTGRPGGTNSSPGDGTLGDYAIVREIGRGGMGVVYEAEQISLGRRVALKVLPFAALLDSRQLQRFKNEALAAAQLDHPHIVDIIGVGCERGVHHYAMRYIDGMTLSDVIGQLRDHAENSGKQSPSPHASPADPFALTVQALTAPTPPPDVHASPQPVASLAMLSSLGSARGRDFFRSAARLGVDAARALDYAHEHGVIHRDIKPGNIMLDRDGKVWVTDFGLAHIETDVSLTMSGDLLGTPRYMSPEQVHGRRAIIDHRSDIYSLGATLYELLTLQPLFASTDRVELLRQIATEDPAPARQIDPRIPADLETIVLKATAKDPQERYETASAVADDLQRFLDHQPIRARRPTLKQRITKWALRHTALVWSAVAILLVSTVALAISTLLIAREQSQTAAALTKSQSNFDEAERQSEEAQRQRERAEENFHRAREAVDTYLTKVSENVLLNQPGLQPLRRDLLELALKYYQDFAQLHEDDPTVQEELADAYERAGHISQILGSSESAIGDHLAALDIRRQLCERHPGNGLYEEGLASSKHALAVIYESKGEVALALAAYAEAISIRERLVQQKPGDAESHSRLANTYCDAAGLYFDLGRNSMAISLYNQAIAILEVVVNQNVTVLKHQEALADAYHALAYVFARRLREHKQQAFNLESKAIALREHLVSENPSGLRNRAALGASLMNQAIVHLISGQPLDSIPLLENAIALAERLAEENPDVADYQSLWGGANLKLAIVRNQLHERDKALAAGSKAVFIQEQLAHQNPFVREYQINLAETYNLVANMFGPDQHEEAVAYLENAVTMGENLVRDEPEYPLHHVTLARSYTSLGDIFEASGDRQAAITVWSRLAKMGDNALENSPDVFWEECGRARYHLGNWSGACEALQRAIEGWDDEEPTLNEGSTRWWYLTMALGRAGEVGKVHACFEVLSLHLTAGMVPARFVKAHQIARLETAELLGASVEIAPSLPDQLRRALAADVRNGPVLVVLGDLLLADEQPDDGRQAYVAAVERLAKIPEDERTRFDWSFLGRALYETERFAEARYAFERLIELRGETQPTLHGRRWWYLALTLARTGETENARACYRQLMHELESTAYWRDERELRTELVQLLGEEDR